MRVIWKRGGSEIRLTLTADILGRLWKMASPFAGPTAVADVIKDLDTQIAVSKALGLATGLACGICPLVLCLVILPAHKACGKIRK